MVGEMALPVFVQNGSYSPNLLPTGSVTFTHHGAEGIQTKKIKQGFVSVPTGSHIHAIIANTTEHTISTIAELGAIIRIPSSI